MKKVVITLVLVPILSLGLLGSCSGCVKKVSKSLTESALDAVEGIGEVVEERGEKVGEKTTDAAGKLAKGVGKSLDRQLDEHATKIASVAGRTGVQAVTGFVDGFNEEVKKHYDEIPHTEDFVSGVSLDFFAKYKSKAIVDAYFIIPERGVYNAKFECKNTDGKIFLTKDIEINRTTDEEDRKYMLVSFALNQDEATAFEQIQNIKITVTKK